MIANKCKSNAFSSIRKGMSLIEVLIVLAIIGLMLTLLFPAVQRIRDRANKAACANNLHQIGVALNLFHTDFGHFPPGKKGSIPKDDNYTLQRNSWQKHCLPYFERSDVWALMLAAYKADRDARSPAHLAPRTAIIPNLECPADWRVRAMGARTSEIPASYTSYVGVTGSGILRSDNGCFGKRPGINQADVLDGLSNTIMVGERPPPNSGMVGWWYTVHDSPPGIHEYEMAAQVGLYRERPTCRGFELFENGSATSRYFYAPGDIADDCHHLHFWSLHVNGSNFMFADTSVRFLGYSAMKILPALATRAGRESVIIPD